MTKRRSSLGT